MAKIITAANMKGGVGKTTFTVSMADALAREKLSVLVVDMDGQASTSRILSLEDTPAAVSMVDVMLCPSQGPDRDQARMQATLRSALRIATRIPGVHHIPARIKMHSASFGQQVQTSCPIPYKILGEALQLLKDEYDVILIDTPPRIDLMTLNALAASDYYVIPFESGDIFAMDGTEDMEACIRQFVLNEAINPNLKLLGAVLQQHRKAEKVCLVTESLVSASYPIFGYVPANTSVKQAAMRKETVLQNDRKCAASVAYVEMAQRIMQICGLEPSGVKVGRKRKGVSDIGQQGMAE